MTSLLFAAAPPPQVTWIRVDKPVFDLVGVVLGAMSLTGALAVAALVLGGLLGLAFILRGRRAAPAELPSLLLRQG